MAFLASLAACTTTSDAVFEARSVESATLVVDWLLGEFPPRMRRRVEAECAHESPESTPVTDKGAYRNIMLVGMSPRPIVEESPEGAP